MKKLTCSNLALKGLGSLLLLAFCAGGALADKNAALEAHQAPLAKAEAMLRERCKTAGEKIYRTVENVEGILLMKLRPSKINYSDQFALGDPYGRDLGGDGYIERFCEVAFRQIPEVLLHLGSLLERVTYTSKPLIVGSPSVTAIPAQ